MCLIDKSLIVEEMTKSIVLTIFAKSGKFLTPDYARNQLRPIPDRRSFYSYLVIQAYGVMFPLPNTRR